MSAPTKIFTYPLTNNTITITQEMGCKAVSIFCSTATSGTVNGGAPLGGLISADLPIEQNETTLFNASDNGGVLTGVVITAPLGCTLQIFAEV